MYAPTAGMFTEARKTAEGNFGRGRFLRGATLWLQGEIAGIWIFAISDGMLFLNER